MRKCDVQLRVPVVQQHIRTRVCDPSTRRCRTPLMCDHHLQLVVLWVPEYAHAKGV